MLLIYGRKVNLSAASMWFAEQTHVLHSFSFILGMRRLMQANQLIEFPVEAVLCIVSLKCSHVLFALEKAACSNNTTLQFAASRHMGRRELLDNRIGTHGRLTCRCTSVLPRLCK